MDAECFFNGVRDLGAKNQGLLSIGYGFIGLQIGKAVLV
jgi:hypothetical protein